VNFVNHISLTDTKIKYQLKNCLPFKVTMTSDSYLIPFLWRCGPTRSLQRPLPDNTQHSQQTSMPPGGIRTHDLSRRVAADLRLRPCSYWDRPYLITLSNLQISCLFVHYYNAHQEITFTEVSVKASTSYCSKEVVSSNLKLQIGLATGSSCVIIRIYRSTHGWI